MASSGTSDQVWVAAGTYYPTTQVGGSGSLFNAFTMKAGIAIYGGFNGTETLLTQRDYTTNVVILNGTGCYHVFNNTDLTLTSTAILDGFTISGGTASGATGSTYNYGGGMLNYTTNSSKTNTSLIRNCRFTGNLSIDSGGAIYNSRYHSPTIYNCSFDNNTTLYRGGAITSISNNTNIMKCNFYNNSKTSGTGTYGGGAIHIGTSYATNVNNISNCNFYNNNANGIGVTDGGKGGAIYTISEPGTLNIVNCFFSGNTAEYGGAILVRTGNDSYRETSTITIKNCIVSGNTATYGGGIFNDNHNTIINNTKIIGNYALQQSGGIYNRYGRPIISSCLITGNKAVNYGGGIYCNLVPTGTTLAQVINCTISGNYSARGGAIALIANSKYYIKNSILSGNVASTNGNNLYLDSSGCTMSLDYCQYTTTDNYVYTGATFTVTNCTTSDPMFVDPIIPTSGNTPNTLGDYRLKGTSPLINAGLNTNITLPIDVRGQQRKLGNLTYSIRDTGPAGGTIFYTNPNYLVDGWCYLEASSVDDTTAIRWSNVSTAIGTTSTSMGTGSGNTFSIISQSGFTSGAASLCNDLIINTFDDWFLPSQDELNLMYQNLYLFNVGNLSGVSYWSSSESGATTAYRQAFATGLKSSSSKTNTYRARAIRRFTTTPSYNITYNGNGYTSGTLPTDTNSYVQGSTVTIAGSGNIVRSGDTFVCWNTTADGTGTNYNTGSTLVISSNTTLYAKWMVYTLAFLPDTQSYVKYKEEVMTSQIDWLINNKDSQNLNLKYVGHIGDVVQDWDTVTSQWDFVKSGMTKFIDSGISYSVIPGNHDYKELTRDSTMFNSYFPLSTFQSMSTYGGSYTGQSDNTYHIVNIDGHDLLILSLEFGPRSSVVTWANSVLSTYSTTKAIIIVHSYLRYDGELLAHADNHAPSNGYGLGTGPPDVNDGTDLWTNLVYPNNNVKFVICGHDGKVDVGAAMKISGHSDNTQIYQMMGNWQYFTNYPGYLLLLKFSSNTVSFRTYSPYLDEYLTSSESQADWSWSW
jgi:hypothetical protein